MLDTEAPASRSGDAFPAASVVIIAVPRRNAAIAMDDSQLGFLFQAAAALERRIWSVGDLVAAMRASLEREFADLWVEGEVSGCHSADSGHLYFTLKDDRAQLRSVMFRAQARLLRFRPEDGMRVLARGRLTAYEARGEVHVAVQFLEPQGAGALQVAFEQLKARLAAEGLFDAGRKKPLPPLPRRIGIVTSPRAAALQDILNILRRRHAGIPITVYPAQVQGEAAPAELTEGIQYFSRTRSVDVVILARGGGSPEDLASFNHEGLARAIAASSVPVISAVGHETDFTIADFVADLRAPTPSAAAELVVESRQQLEECVAGLAQRLGRAARYRLVLARNALTGLAQHGAFARMQESLARRQQRLDEAGFRLAGAFAARLQQRRRALDVAATRLRHFDLRRLFTGMRRELAAGEAAFVAAARRLLLERRARTEQSVARLEALSPLKILDRGYALVLDAAGNLLKDPRQVRPGDEITARLARGSLSAVVRKSS